MNRDGTLSLPGVDASHVYVRALALGFASTVTLLPEHFEGADRVAGQLRGDKECPFSGVTKSGRVWRKVPESDARCVCVSVCVCRWERKSSAKVSTQSVRLVECFYVHRNRKLIRDRSLKFHTAPESVLYDDELMLNVLRCHLTY